MEVWDWWPFLKRRKKTIFWICVLVVLVTMAVTFVIPPTYRSVATLNVQPLAQDQALSFPSASQMGAKNAGELVKSPAIALRAAKALNKSKLDGKLEYRVPENSGLILVTNDANSPQLAADEANAVAAAFIAQNTEMVKTSVSAARASLERQLVGLRAQIAAKQKELADARSKPDNAVAVAGLQDELDSMQTGYEGVLQRGQLLPGTETLLVTSVNIADKALPDSKPVSPQPALNLILALAGGLLLGVAVARATEPPREKRGAGE